MSDNLKARNLWRRGDKLLTLSRQAREQGHADIADDILDRATQLLEEARVLEQLPDAGVVPLTPSEPSIPADSPDEANPSLPLSGTGTAILEDA